MGDIFKSVAKTLRWISLRFYFSTTSHLRHTKKISTLCPPQQCWSFY